MKMSQDDAKAVVKVLERSIYEYTEGGIGWCNDVIAENYDGVSTHHGAGDVKKCCLYGILGRSMELESGVSANEVYDGTLFLVRKCAIDTGRHYNKALSWWNDGLEGTEEECKVSSNISVSKIPLIK